MEIVAVLKQALDAVRAGDVQQLEGLLSNTPELVRTREAEGHTLLNLSCKIATGDVARPPVRGTAKQHAAIDRLLALGADPSVAANDGWAPLHAAAMTGHVDLARRLLAAGARREGRLMGKSGGSPLSLALFYGEREVAEVLADPAIPDNLRSAAGLGRSLERFFSGSELTRDAAEGSDFYRPIPEFPEWVRRNNRQELLDEALSWAARNGQLASMEFLVERGANVNANPYRGTPLLWATFADCVEAAEWLLDNGADPDLRHDFGGTNHGVSAVAMHLAAQYSCVKCLRLLLDRGADPTIRDAAYNGTPLQWAQHAGAQESIQMLS